MKRSRLCTDKQFLKKLRLKHGSDPDSKFDKRQLAMGVKVEMEHTDCPAIAKKIAKAHLSEKKFYYSVLKKVGL
jgi:hypothetical protein